MSQTLQAQLDINLPRPEQGEVILDNANLISPEDKENRSAKIFSGPAEGQSGTDYRGDD
ncbi:MAG: hypothetical protein R3C11_27810 [Planctomycetaceae bacterium]